MIGLNEFGQIELGWSLPIAGIEDLSRLSTTKLAVPLEDDSEYLSDTTEWAWITNRDDMANLRKFVLKPGVEVSFTPHNDYKAANAMVKSLSFQSIDSERMLLQADFAEPSAVEWKDQITVKFWRNDLFRSSDSASEAWMPFDTELKIEISHQIDQEEADRLHTLAAFFIVLICIAFALILILAAFYGSIMTFWMAINSFQLLIYTVLLQIPLPANAFYFMKLLLGAMRLHTYSDDSASQQQDLADEGQSKAFLDLTQAEDSTYTSLLLNLGYQPLFWSNVAVLVNILAFLACLWLLACLA